MTRIDYEGVWEASNVELVTRTEHCSKQKEYKARMRDIGIHKKPGRKGTAHLPKTPRRQRNKAGEIVYVKMKVN